MISRKILIDLVKMRDFPDGRAEGIYREPGLNTEFKSIRELATFLYTCRKCETAPCVDVCPSEALEKLDDGMITRHLQLCVRCKSCVAICPFGTLMDDIFEKKDRRYFLDLEDKKELDRLVEESPGQAISYYEGEEDPDQNIYQLTEKILVKDYVWIP